MIYTGVPVSVITLSLVCICVHFRPFCSLSASRVLWSGTMWSLWVLWSLCCKSTWNAYLRLSVVSLPPFHILRFKCLKNCECTKPYYGFYQNNFFRHVILGMYLYQCVYVNVWMCFLKSLFFLGFGRLKTSLLFEIVRFEIFDFGIY